MLKCQLNGRTCYGKLFATMDFGSHVRHSIKVFPLIVSALRLSTNRQILSPVAEINFSQRITMRFLSSNRISLLLEYSLKMKAWQQVLITHCFCYSFFTEQRLKIFLMIRPLVVDDDKLADFLTCTVKCQWHDMVFINAKLKLIFEGSRCAIIKLVLCQ